MSNPQANIHPNAKIASDAIIEPFATIGDNVEIGSGTWIGPGAVIMSGARIGKNCKIFPGAVISAIPQDLKFAGEDTTVIIGDNTTIRECVTINRGTVDMMTTKIGNNCLVMAYSHLGHDTIMGDNCVVANSVNIAGHVTIGDWAIIEGMVGVQQFTRIGHHAFVAGGSMVRKSVPPYVKAAREPISYVGVNTIGLRRRGYTNEQVTNIEDVYRVVYVQNKNITQALKIADIELPNSKEKTEILDFINSETKGIMRGFN
ncbi:acyl-ACP--UDP-N-acetylglucosamine O-acyltransferase [Flavobacteriales bacterium]|nr:acyl-ACP--UDP-N-acetylglucosamine O-acyltransferase [Flavobacteriales bacterium]